MEEKPIKKKKPLLFRIAVKIIKLFYKKREIIGIENLPKEPCIIIGNHSQIHGPLTSELYYPRKKSIWCTWEMRELKEVPRYAQNIFWPHKPKRSKWLFKILSYLIAPIASYALYYADTLPVYRDKRIIVTLKKSLTALHNGEDVIIFPETDDGYNNIINELQEGFLEVAKFYYTKYKKELNIVPMYNGATIKTVVFGKPIKFDATKPYEEQKDEICNYLKKELTHIATSLPRHRVIPFLNRCDKKEYPYSKE